MLLSLPDDAKTLRAAARTLSTSPHDLGGLLTTLGTGEAVVTVLGETDVPTPVAWTRLRAPPSSMDPAPADDLAAALRWGGRSPAPCSARDDAEAQSVVGPWTTQIACAATWPRSTWRPATSTATVPTASRRAPTVTAVSSPMPTSSR